MTKGKRNVGKCIASNNEGHVESPKIFSVKQNG